MIIYHPAFDLYHCVYRILLILNHFKRADSIEIDRLRIWDYYLLFPDEVNKIKLKREEKDIAELFKTFISKRKNPYEEISDGRKMLEKLKPFQLSAIKFLASHNLISKDYLSENRVKIISREKLGKYFSNYESTSHQERNVLAIMTSHFYQMSMFGKDGLKAKTQLLESRYDAK